MRIATPIATLLLAGALAVAAHGTGRGTGQGAVARAQTPPPEIEARALEIEKQLLCPQCTSKRLDVCDLAICDDMRRLIRARLAEGDTPDEIVRFFSDRYGQRVLADLPRSGFNLVLFGWVGGSVALMALAGAAVLVRMRRSARPAPAAELNEREERWLDDQLDDQPDDQLDDQPEREGGQR